MGAEGFIFLRLWSHQLPSFEDYLCVGIILRRILEGCVERIFHIGERVCQKQNETIFFDAFFYTLLKYSDLRRQQNQLSHCLNLKTGYMPDSIRRNGHRVLILMIEK